MKILASQLSPLQPAVKPIVGGARSTTAPSRNEAFSDDIARVTAAGKARPLHRHDLRQEKNRAEREELDTLEEVPAGAVEILLPEDAFTSSFASEPRVADLGGQPTSLAPAAPGSPAAAYARAAELRFAGPERGSLFNAVI